MIGLGRGRHDEPDWPGSDEQRTVLLVDASSEVERRIVSDWLQRRQPDGATVSVVAIPPSRRRAGGGDLSALEVALAEGDDALLAPVRVAWLPRKREGVRQARLSDIPRLSDPHDPGRLRQRLLVAREPDRWRLVAAEPARASELRQRWRDAGFQERESPSGLAEFVARQAVLALERAERRLRGTRYKVPRFVHEGILARPSFRGGIERLARTLGRDPAKVSKDAARYLREIAATHSPFVIDIAAQLIRRLTRRGYGDVIAYDPDDLARVKALGQQHPVVFLPSHKSNLDHLVLQRVLHENGHAPNHTAGGINMNFFPLGPIVRRSGVFFIRRTFKDNPVYKFTLSSYVDYLIEKRFSLEWYIEGGRSRSGKLLPPRFGLLATVVDAWRRGKADDVVLVPVSIAYDQIQDVGEYAAEQRGEPKEAEGFGWLIGVIRRLGRRYGGIHVRFGEPISLAKALERPETEDAPAPDEQSLDVQKLAFEVCARINRCTPITESSLLALAMLGSGFRALALDEVVVALRNVLAFVRDRRLPTCGPLALDEAAGVQRALDALVDNGVVTRSTEGLEPLYLIGPDQQLAAAYYRNSIIHVFVDACIAELSLLRAAQAEGEPLEAFWDEAMQLRDLLKFEFFFAEKESFRAELAREMAWRDGAWEARVERGSEEIVALLSSFKPFSSHRVLRPFVEAYEVVGDLLEREADQDFDAEPFLARCLKLGKQYHQQRRIHSAQSVSKVLFQSALRLAENRDVVSGDVATRTARRRAFADEIRSVSRRVEAINALAASRRAGLIA